MVPETEALFRKPAVQELEIPGFRHLGASHHRRLPLAYLHLRPQAAVAVSKAAPSVRRRQDHH